MICHKCAGRGTKRHHRGCEHRGKGHLGRGDIVRWIYWRAAEYGYVLRVRLGRHGAGLSLPAARAYLVKRARAGYLRGTEADVRALAALHAGCDADDVRVTTDAREPGTVRAWLPADTPIAAVDRAQRALADHMPAHALFAVDRAEEKAAAVCAAVPDALVPLLVEHPTWSPADAEAEREHRERFGHPSERCDVDRVVRTWETP